MPAQEVTRRDTVDKARDGGRTEVAASEALIEGGVFGWTVADEYERIELRKGFEVAGEFRLAIFAGGIKRSWVGVAEGGNMDRSELSRTGVHIFETVSVTKGFDVMDGFVVTGNHEDATCATAKKLAGFVEAASPGNEVSGTEVIIRILIEQLVEGFQIGVDVREEQNLHCSDYCRRLEGRE